MCPEFDECDPVAKSLGFLHEMRHQQDCRSAVTNMLDEFPGIPAGLRIEPGCHLVEDGDLGRADERQHHGQALLLAAGERAVVGRALIGEPERPDQLTHIGRMTIEGPVHVDDLADSELGREGARLQLHAGDLVDTGFVGLRVDAHQADRPRVWGPEADGALDCGGLSCPIRSEDSEDLALGYRERDVVDSDQRTVGLAQLRDLNGRRSWLFRLGARRRRSSRLTPRRVVGLHWSIRSPSQRPLHVRSFLRPVN